MATPSKMMPLGTEAPDFSLPDVVTGTTVQRDLVRGPKGLLVMFLSRHCPFVQHVQSELARIGRDYLDSGIGIVAIGSNDIEASPTDTPERLADQAREAGFRFPYAYDETQDVARRFGAACTPDYFLFDDRLTLVYRGQLDDSTPGNKVPVTGVALRAALDAVQAGSPVPPDQKPSMGCSIKWKG